MTATATQATCHYTGSTTGRCTSPATHLVDGTPYCTTDATLYIHGAETVERIAPTPTPAVPADYRGACHFCGLELNRRGECDECR